MPDKNYINRPPRINQPMRLFTELPNNSDCFLSGRPEIPDEPVEYVGWQDLEARQNRAIVELEEALGARVIGLWHGSGEPPLA